MTRPSVIVPAYNEEAVIARTLRTLLSDPESAEGFAVLVVCNGCTDRTAEVVRAEFPAVALLELAEGSKVAALNAGLAAAPDGPVLLLDADIELDACTARALLDAAAAPGTEAAIGRMRIDTSGASTLVRTFYRVWLEHPYLRHGKFAAAIALSAGGRARIGTLPRVTADDTYLRRLIPPQRVALVDGASFVVRVPRTLGALVRVRARSHRGTRQLDAHAPLGPRARSAEARGLVGHLCTRPTLWPAALVYLGVTLAARLRSRLADGARWERDETSRTSTGSAN